MARSLRSVVRTGATSAIPFRLCPRGPATGHFHPSSRVSPTIDYWPLTTISFNRPLRVPRGPAAVPPGG